MRIPYLLFFVGRYDIIYIIYIIYSIAEYKTSPLSERPAIMNYFAAKLHFFAHAMRHWLENIAHQGYFVRIAPL